MKKEAKQQHVKPFNDQTFNHWHEWLRHILTQKEYNVLIVYYDNTLQQTSTLLDISPASCRKLLKSSLRKISYYFKIYHAIQEKARVILWTKTEFLKAPLLEVGVSTRLYHILNGMDILSLEEVIRYGIPRLKRLRGFGDKALIELRSILKLKDCLHLLE